MTDRPVRTLVTVFGADAAALALGAGTALRATPHAPAPGDPPRGHTSVARRAARATHGRSGSAGRPVAGTPRPLAPRPARRLGGRGRRTLLRLPPVQLPGLLPHGPLQRVALPLDRCGLAPLRRQFRLELPNAPARLPQLHPQRMAALPQAVHPQRPPRHTQHLAQPAPHSTHS